MIAPLLITLLCASPSANEVQQSVEKVLAKGNYQRELPGAAVGKPQKLRLRSGPPVARASVPVGPLAIIARAVMWIVIAVVLCLVAIWIIRELTGFRRDKPARGGEDGEDEGEGVDADRVVQRPLGDAEALARAGRFAEAIHVLLLRTLEALSRTTALSPADTSREILGRLNLPQSPRRALEQLVTAVEITHFGTTSPGEAEYRTCRAHFEHFAATYLQSRA